MAETFDEHNIVNLPLYDEPFVVATPKSHPWSTRDAVASSELVGESLLLLTQGNCFRDQVLAVCDRNAQPRVDGHPLAQALSGSSLTTIRHMVASGVGITVLPATSVSQGDRDLLSILPFSGSPPTRRVVLATRRHFPRMNAIRALAQAIRTSGLSPVQMLDDRGEPLVPGRCAAH